MFPIELLPWRESSLEKLDGRTLADVGIDRHGDPLNGNDPRFRRRQRTPSAFLRLIHSLAALASRGSSVAGLPMNDNRI